MSGQDIAFLIIGLGLLLGTFVSAWVFFKAVRQIEQKEEKKKSH